MSQQQTVLRVDTNIPHETISGTTQFTTLDLYGDIPIKINKSIAEIQDISKRNSDLSIGLTLPGSKKNNRFFETFYNVDTQSLYFDPTKRVSCNVLLNDQTYFKGYLRLNKISVLESKVEYDVTLYSTVGNLFGEIGNNLLQDLDFDDTEYTFNHTFSLTGVTNLFGNSNFYRDSEYPYTYFYPIVHNGYEYSGGTINFTGVTSGQTRLYTSTSPIGSWNNYSGVTAAGVEEYRINSPIYGLRDNQLKPGLNVWSLIKLIFKTYGYTIKSDFMNTPWMKSLYLYGYFSYEGTKFGWRVNNIQQLPPSGVDINFDLFDAIIVKKGTGIPCYCTENIDITVPHGSPYFTTENATILAGTSGFTYQQPGFPDQPTAFSQNGQQITNTLLLSYYPKNVGETGQYEENDLVTFDLVIDQNIKQIDLLSSISKKFNLVFIPDPEITGQIIVEPYDYYIGTGEIYDWTPKLSWDKGFTVEPAQNFIESSLLLTDLEDGDEGNREFKNRVNRIYGRNIVYNPTDFKSQDKTIDTIFSPELIRKWDDNIGLPLGINYSATSDIDKVDNQVRWSYKGVKTKPKLFYWVGTANPFIDDVNEVYSISGTNFNTFTVKVAPSNITIATVSFERIPVVSHTMPLGLSDTQKINNDSLSILFNSELPVDIGVQTYNVYTRNDVYNTFYRTRIDNIYDPNTRMVSGYFDLKYSDVQNFQWKDIIKINEQYFTINKISEFNLTNRELTKVELIQLNVNPQEYIDRYFSYSYCDNPSLCYKLKTDFTNPNLQDTNFIWSTYYDQQVGSLTGTTTGFTSTFRLFNTGSFQEEYIPYTMEEITETDYVSGSCYDSSCDTMLNYIYGNVNGLNYSLASFWENTAGTFTGTNLWSNCAGFYSTNSTYVITTGSSTTYGVNSCQCIDIGTGFNGGTRPSIQTIDGKIIIGGSFTTYKGVTNNRIVRILTNGTTDTFSTNGFSGGTLVPQLRSISQQTTGGIICSGDFLSYNGTSVNYLCRLNTDGSLDTTFNSGGTGPGSPIEGIVSSYVTSDDKVYIGYMQTYNGVSKLGLLKLNSDGSVDGSWNSPTGSTSATFNFRPQSSGKMIVSNQTYSGVTMNYLGRLNLDGTPDTTFNSGGTGFTSCCTDFIAIQNDDKILVANRSKSSSGTYNGTTIDYICRINSNGTLDGTFATSGTGFNNFIQTILILSSGKILVGGFFTSYNGTSVGRICRLNSDGSLDTTFNNGGTGFNNVTTNFLILNDGNILVVGNFTSYNGTTANRIVKLNPDGVLLNCV